MLKNIFLCNMLVSVHVHFSCIHVYVDPQSYTSLSVHISEFVKSGCLCYFILYYWLIGYMLMGFTFHILIRFSVGIDRSG